MLAMRMDPLGDQRAGARKALGLNLTPQARLIRTALREAGLEVGDIGIDFPGATIATLVEREGLGPDPAADGLRIEATGCSNLAEGLALGKAGLDLLIAVRPGGVPGTLLLLEPWRTPIAGQGPCHGGGLRWAAGHMAGPGAELPGPLAGRLSEWLT